MKINPNDCEKKWVNAYHLFLAKEALDSVMYIAENAYELSSFDLHTKNEEKRRTISLELRNVYAARFPFKQIKALRLSDEKIKNTFYEADKRYSHLDSNYHASPSEKNWDAEIDKLKLFAYHCLHICKGGLPSVFEFDFIPYDKELFFLTNGITRTKLEDSKKAVHPMYGKHDNETPSESRKVFNYIEEIPSITNPNEYGTICDCGITLFEGLQNRQEWAIKTNILAGLNIWVSPKWKSIEEAKQREKESFELAVKLYKLSLKQ
jgi:hypothetical protein